MINIMLDKDQYYVRQGSILCKTRINNMLDKDKYYVRLGSVLC